MMITKSPVLISKSLIRKVLLVLGIIIAMVAMLSVRTQAQQKPVSMKLNAGVITAKLAETKVFYQNVLGFEIVFENDFYVLLQTPGGLAQLSFLAPSHPSQQPIFQPQFSGKGVYLTIEVDHVDLMYDRIKALGIPIRVELRNES